MAKRLHGSRYHLVYGCRSRPTRHCVRCGATTPRKKGTPTLTQFLVHVYCGQMVGWIEMKLGMKVSLCPGHIVQDGDPAPPPPKRGQSPQFAVHFYCGQTAGCIKMPLGMEVGLGPSHTVLHGDPALPNKRGTASHFWPMSISK